MKTALLLLTLFQSSDIFPITAKPEPPKAESGRYLVVFTASWCQPCRTWKANERSKLQGVAITTVDVDEQQQWGVTTVPSFWIVDRATRKPIKKFTGSTSAATLLKELETLSPSPAASEGVPQLYGRVGTSHESRETLINHLLTDGIHKGRHTLTELSAMTDEQLDALHNREHNQSAGTPSNTQWTIQPRKVQTVRRRRGFFFEW